MSWQSTVAFVNGSGKSSPAITGNLSKPEVLDSEYPTRITAWEVLKDGLSIRSPMLGPSISVLSKSAGTSSGAELEAVLQSLSEEYMTVDLVKDYLSMSSGSFPDTWLTLFLRKASNEFGS